MTDLIWLIPALPLAGAVFLLLFGRRLGEPVAGWLATAACSASFLATVGLYLTMLGRDGEDRIVVQSLWSWMPVGGLELDFALLADPLSITMALFVTGVAALIHLYAIGYMHGDEKFPTFFLYLNLFVTAMLLLVLGENLIVTFLGWEGVGVCSYWLISFWQTRSEAAVAGKKAFVTNRIGDVGFMLGSFLAFSAVGSLSYLEINEAAPELATSTAAAIGLLLFLGACGKSAQLPLSVWLPDAMAGPTPVSALIHAATMVTAGVFLMVRISPVLAEVPEVGTVIAVVGLVTSLWAALSAIAQTDIKKVLAYSTVSQLGLMFLAVGTGGYVAAIFHVVTHAFFKALLFLGAGSVIHGMHDEQDIRRMGGLYRLLPITSITYLVGWLAISGVPPFSGFWSKDEILLYAYNESVLLWAGGLVVALLTAYYMTRQVMLVFFTSPRWGAVASGGVEPEPVPASVGAAVNPNHVDDELPHRLGEGTPHESPWTMTLPLVVLAVAAAVGGVMQLPFSKDLHFLEHWLEPSLEGAEAELTVASGTKWILGFIAIAVALAGIGAAWAVYQRRRVRAVEPVLFERAFRLDDAYAAAAGGPGRAAFDGAAWVDSTLVDGAVEGTGTVTGLVGRFVRKAQTGFVRTYALGIAMGGVLLLAWFVFRGIA
jgi:NADH-quinone oxidoreductase subunit L